MLGADHSAGGVIIGGSLKRAGLGGGIVRYACAGRSDVNITASEVRDLKANGVPIGVVCEHEADWLLRPNVSGRVSVSRDICRSVGLPDGVIYMAADFDATLWGTPQSAQALGNMRGIANALGQAAQVIGHQNVGFYGSYFAIEWLRANVPWVQWFWQAEAWSIGRRSPHAQLFQRAQAMTVAGVSVDVDEIWQPYWGQRTAAPPKPKPKPVQPAGHFNFQGSLSLPDGHWHVQGTKSKDVVFGASPHDRWAVAKHRVCVAGPHRGQHQMIPEPWE